MKGKRKLSPRNGSVPPTGSRARSRQDPSPGAEPQNKATSLDNIFLACTANPCFQRRAVKQTQLNFPIVRKDSEHAEDGKSESNYAPSSSLAPTPPLTQASGSHPSHGGYASSHPRPAPGIGHMEL
ncbi:hypothetical protein PG994_013000 [Apiospora phragmitis]|uniref:Uncharacterized protein n=1 Tax=Apiospora phragmitis TaxID=2905665 RepID=A0ABR1T7W5_9PEZI